MTVVPMFKKILLLGGLLAVAIAVVGGTIGVLVDGLPGLLGAVVGAGMTFVFLGLTAASIILATRLSGGQMLSPVFFGVVLGGWLLKLGAFLIIVILFAGQAAVNPYVMLGTIVTAVVGSLVIDGYAFVGSRVPYVDDAATAGKAAPEPTDS